MSERELAPRGEANKIDWTKPLRVVGTHERVRHIEIDFTGKVTIYVDRGSKGTQIHRIDPAGHSVFPDPVFHIENIPPEPRIVERWIVVRPCWQPGAGSDYMAAGKWQQDIPAHLLRERPKDVPANYRIAKVLIEEPE